jgi:type I restriction enzyme S subunit
MSQVDKRIKLPPTHWASTKLDCVVNIVRGVTYKKDQASDFFIEGYLPVIRANNIQNDKLILSDFVYVDAKIIKCAQKIKKNDIVVAMSSGSKSIVGKTAKAEADLDAGFGAFCGLLRPSNLIIPEMISFYTRSAYYRNKVSELSAGANINNLKPAHFSELDFPLPPLAEQKEIAERLDKLLAQVEATQAHLARIPDIIKQFRQSVLAAAVSGKLTEKWRNISGGNKKASKTEILDARRLAWENFEFKRLTKNEKLPVNDKWKQKYKEPSEVLLDNVFDIPESWVWSNLGELSWSVKDGPHYSPKYTESGVPFISGGNVSSSGIDFSNCKYISHDLHEELSRRCKPDIGDILYTKGGTTGIAFFNTEERDFNVWVHVAVLKITPITNGFYLQHALNSQHCYGQSQNYTHGVGNQDLGLTRMVNITIPVPPVDEQTEIVRRVEQLFAYADSIEQQAKAAKERVDNLTQAILAKAFRGELTADWRAANPDLISGDNSAEALLEKIKTERQAMKLANKHNKKTVSKPNTKKNSQPKTHSENSVINLINKKGTTKPQDIFDELKAHMDLREILKEISQLLDQHLIKEVNIDGQQHLEINR